MKKINTRAIQEIKDLAELLPAEILTSSNGKSSLADTSKVHRKTKKK